jgi:hypothetical protein
VFTESFVRDSVMPEVAATGGATVLASPYGMPLALLRMDKYQPKTWIVGMGAEPDVIDMDSATPELVTTVANSVLDSVYRNAWTAVGFWVNDGRLFVEPVETYTNHYMAVEAAKRNDQMAIYALHTQELEWMPVKLSGEFDALRLGQ